MKKFLFSAALIGISTSNVFALEGAFTQCLSNDGSHRLVDVRGDRECPIQDDGTVIVWVLNHSTDEEVLKKFRAEDCRKSHKNERTQGYKGMMCAGEQILIE